MKADLEDALVPVKWAEAKIPVLQERLLSWQRSYPYKIVCEPAPRGLKCRMPIAHDPRAGWPLMPPELQKEAYAQVAVGGPRRLPPSTHTEWVLRRYAPSNFVH